MQTIQISVEIVFFLKDKFCCLAFGTLNSPSRDMKLLHGLANAITRCLEEINNLNIGGDAYLVLYALIRGHFLVCIDGNK